MFQIKSFSVRKRILAFTWWLHSLLDLSLNNNFPITAISQLLQQSHCLFFFCFAAFFPSGMGHFGE